MRLKPANTRFSLEAHRPFYKEFPRAPSFALYNMRVWVQYAEIHELPPVVLGCAESRSIFGFLYQNRGRNCCGNGFFQSFDISDAKVLLSGGFWGNALGANERAETPTDWLQLHAGPNSSPTTRPRGRSLIRTCLFACSPPSQGLHALHARDPQQKGST